MGASDATCSWCTSLHGRRTLLRAVLGLGLSLPSLTVATAQDIDPRKTRPQENDRFVFLFGERQGELVTPADVRVGQPPLLAYPMEAHTQVIRNGSRLNQVLLIRLDPEELATATRARAAQGIVAYSAVCTHTGCPVSVWQEETKTFKCPCHDSEFDPKDGARVVAGPAPKRLAVLPLKITNGVLMAASGFVGRVGFKRR